jgi:hypothetical protein
MVITNLTSVLFKIQMIKVNALHTVINTGNNLNLTVKPVNISSQKHTVDPI